MKINSIPKLGDANQEVVILQRAIKDLGFDPGSLDGVFGPKTKLAISQIQIQNHLAGSGVIGPKTLQILGLEVVVSSPVTGQPSITKDLKGKKGRHLHPTLRLLMEQKIFPSGEIPESFLKKDIKAMTIATTIGLAELGVKEKGGNNHGREVGFIQSVIGVFKENGTGDAWCMSTVQCVVSFIEDYLEVESPVTDSEHCMTVLSQARRVKGLVTTLAEPGTMFIGQHGKTQNGHTGMVIKSASGKMNTFEGNTSDDNMTDGSGAFFRLRDQMVNGNLYIRGFVRIYPNNSLEGV